MARAAAPTVEPDGYEYTPPSVRPTAGLITSSLVIRARAGPTRQATARGRSRRKTTAAATTEPASVTAG